MRERPIHRVPFAGRLVLLFALALQGGWHLFEPGPVAVARPLPPAPPAGLAQVAALGDPASAARVLMLWLQAADSQAGGSLPFAELDYGRVTDWLRVILKLDARFQYPLLSASRVYAQVTDPLRKRQMLEFVYRAFLQAPNLRWPWLAHAVVQARHSLDDEPLALRYARALTEHATGDDVPAWARDMSVLLLADLGEVETARVLMGGLIEAGRLTDPHELWFLTQRLDEARLRGEQP